MNLNYFIVIQGCPVYADIGSYIQICLEDAYPGKRHASVNSIYRGVNAQPILNRYGKLSQAQLYYRWTHRWPGYLPANPPGHSSHEKRGDGFIYGAPSGSYLAWWQQGFDVNDNEVDAVTAAAARHGWHLYQPYSSGLEHHHLNFRVQPKRPALLSAEWRRMQRIRATYPRR